MEDCIRAAMVDDDAVFLHMFRKKVETLFAMMELKAEIIAFTSAGSFLEANEKEHFDVVFLDIDMPEMNGIALASELRGQEADAALIFVSAHENFVFESIRYTPFRFIRKHVLEEDVREAVRALSKMMENRRRFVTLELHAGGQQRINLSKVIYFYTIRHALFFYDSDGKSVELASRCYNMGMLEKMLGEHGYIRTHRSYLLNFRYIYLIQSDRILLTEETSAKGHTCIPLSRRRTQEVKDQYRLLLRGEQPL